MRFLATALALLATACDLTLGSTSGPTQVSSQNVTINPSPAPSATPTPLPASAPFCDPPSAPVTYVRFGLRTGGSCRVAADRGCAIASLARGSATTLDISPLSGADLVACHGLLQLSLSGTGCEQRSGGGSDFLPTIAGIASGDCRLTATVNGVSNTLVIEVR